MTRPDLAAAIKQAEEALAVWHDRHSPLDPLSLAFALRSLLAATAPAPSSPPPPASEAVRKAAERLRAAITETYTCTPIMLRASELLAALDASGAGGGR